jgi:mRNA interferase MazF
VASRGRAPDRGDLVWLEFNPQAGHEQAGRRPAIVLSPQAYNDAAGLMICCPITSQVKRYPFEVRLEPGLPIQGVVLADQVKSLDWNKRKAKVICKAPPAALAEVLAKVKALLD